MSNPFHYPKVKIENSNQQKQYNRWSKLLQITTIVFSAQFSQFTWADLLNANLINIDPKTVNAEAWMIYDPQSKQIIAQHNADVPRAPASLTKMMVAYLTLKAIENGQIQLNQQVTVPEIVNTVQWDESQLKLEPNQQISVQELLAGLIIMSANDAALTLATLIAGNVPSFLDQMNVMANQLGMQHTHFSNPSGITMQDHLSSAHDMAILSSAIVNDTPEFLQYSKQPEFRYKDIYHEATNILLKKDLSVDGLKTGYTRKSGFQISLLSINDDEYLLGIYFGGNSAKERNNKINFLMNKFRNKDVSKNEKTKKLTVKNENKSSGNYTVQTSSFKKISKSKMHITLLKNKIKILRSFEHQIKKNGRYFISYINVDDQQTAKNLCNEIKLNKLDCLIKAS